MTNDDNIGDEKLHTILTEYAKISALPSGKIDKHEYLMGKVILSSNWSQITEKTKFTYSLLWKALENREKSWCFKVSKSFW